MRHVVDVAISQGKSCKLTKAFDTRMNLGVEPAARTSQSFLPFFFNRPDSMLMSAYSGAVNEDLFELGVFTQNRLARSDSGHGAF